MRPDCCAESSTILSVRLHQICTGTHESAIARAYVIGLRSANFAGEVTGVPPTSLRARCCFARPICPQPRARHAWSHVRSAHRVQPAPVDVHPRQLRLDDVGHAREIVDLAAVAPGVQGQQPAVTVRVDNREAADRGQVAPAAGVDLSVDGAAVGRDDQRDCGVVARAVAGGQEQICVAAMPVMRAVGDRDLAGRRSRGELVLRVGDRRRLRRKRRSRSDSEEGCEGEGPQQACLEKRCGSHAATVERGPNPALSAP